MARFQLAGRIEVVWLTTVPADPAAPTGAEITAGTDLIGSSQLEELQGIQGWEIQPSTIATPGYASTKVGNIAGDETYPDSSLSFYKDSNSEIIYTAMVAGTEGWMAFMRDGSATGEECELFPATISSRSRRPARSEAHIFDVNFSIAAPYDGVLAA